MALSTREPQRPVLGATRARQGRVGRHVFWVLFFGTLLTALALFAAWAMRSGDLARAPADNGRASSGQQTFDAPPPQPVMPTPAQKQPGG